MVLDRTMVGKPREKFWITFIKNRIKRNKNFMGFCSGPTGSGKSWSCLSIGESIDPNFSIDNVVFSGTELMSLVNSGKLAVGSCIIFEEGGVALSNRSWQSVTNKMLNYLIQTWRHLNFVFLMNSPYMDFVDVSTRKLFHAEFETLSIDKKNRVCKIKPRHVQYNGRLSKFYYKQLMVIKSEGVVPVYAWNVPAPSKELIKAYEIKKTVYTTALNKRIYDELVKEENKGKGKDEKGFVLTEIQQDTLDMLREGLNVSQIAEARDRHPSVIGAALRSLKSKGFRIKAVYDGLSINHYEVFDPEEK